MRHWFSDTVARRSTVFSLVGAAAIAAGALSFEMAAYAAGTPAVQITPDHGPYTTVTVVTGQNFAPHEQVAIYKQTRPFFAYETDANGSFVGQPHPMMGPGPVSGVITINAIGRTSGRKATTTYTVTP
jgi:hypothetical protein